VTPYHLVHSLGTKAGADGISDSYTAQPAGASETNQHHHDDDYDIPLAARILAVRTSVSLVLSENSLGDLELDELEEPDSAIVWCVWFDTIRTRADD